LVLNDLTSSINIESLLFVTLELEYHIATR